MWNGGKSSVRHVWGLGKRGRPLGLPPLLQRLPPLTRTALAAARALRRLARRTRLGLSYPLSRKLYTTLSLYFVLTV